MGRVKVSETHFMTRPENLMSILALPRSGGLLPGEGWDAVAVNCKKGAITENQGECA